MKIDKNNIDYNGLYLKLEYLGKTIHYKGRNYKLKNDMPAHQKRFFYKMGFKYIFNINALKDKNDEEIVVQNEPQNVPYDRELIEYINGNVEDYNLHELRAKYPTIKAVSKLDFIKKIHEYENNKKDEEE